jgi:hypothetical protein
VSFGALAVESDHHALAGWWIGDVEFAIDGPGPPPPRKVEITERPRPK